MLNDLNPISLSLSVAALLIAFVVHELSHALSAYWLGDPTPKQDGRISLNPLKHLDPMGTIAMLVFRFGWGKPVKINPYHFKNPRRDSALTALAGPASNLLLTALFAGLVWVSVGIFGQALMDSWVLYFVMFCYTAVYTNLSLALFNLLPVAPLDGSHIITGLLPYHTAQAFSQTMHRFGPMILIMMVLPIFEGASLVSYFLWPIIENTAHFLLPI